MLANRQQDRHSYVNGEAPTAVSNHYSPHGNRFFRDLARAEPDKVIVAPEIFPVLEAIFLAVEGVFELLCKD